MLNELYDLFGYNKDIFITINSMTNVSILPYILQMVSKLFFIGNFAVAYVVLCTYCYFQMLQSPNREKTFNNYYYELVRIGTIYAFFGLSYAAMKFSFNLPRPFCSLTTDQFITIIDTNDERCLSSFPSAHTALALIVCHFLWSHVSKLSRILLVLLILAVAISRITLAMHYPADILFSLFIAIVIIYVGNMAYLLLKNNLIKNIGAYIFIFLFKKS